MATAIMAILLAVLVACHTAPEKPKPPVTPRKMVTDNLHGVKVEDPYRWLEDQQSPETRKWIKEQMAYTRTEIGRAHV